MELPLAEGIPLMKERYADKDEKALEKEHERNRFKMAGRRRGL